MGQDKEQGLSGMRGQQRGPEEGPGLCLWVHREVRRSPIQLPQPALFLL